MIELLAPAKNAEVGRVAIDAGADAVYIGGPAFGARKAAGNSIEDIASLVNYAHRFGCQVLVTLNTLLLSDEERHEAQHLLDEYDRIGVDAVIVQDQDPPFPPSKEGYRLHIHASTQCDNRDLARVKEMEAKGYHRVVLARELSYDEIRAIREQTSCELEAFVHGALCVSYSGACYLSERVCGRSANRGECAQMCRLPYDVLDEEGREILHQKHVLSLRDLDRSHELRELIDAGVTTLKIEGRLKDADYVKNIVAYYRMLLDEMGVESRSVTRFPDGRSCCRRQFVPNPAKTFHRGETTYFGHGRQLGLVNMETPKSTGEYIGKAPLSAQAIAGLHNGDGLTFGSEGFYWPNKSVRIPAGVAVYRNYDAAFQRELMREDAVSRVLPVRLVFEEVEEGFRLRIESAMGVREAVMRCEKVAAQNAERAEAVVKQQLSKLGGTGMEAYEVVVRWQQPYFLTAAALNEVRRQAVEATEGKYPSEPHSGAREPNALPPMAQKRASLERFVPLNGAVGWCSRPPALKRSEGYMSTAEEAGADAPVMECKYCLLYEMGCCKKEVPDMGKKRPAYLRGQNGLMLKIETDCKACVMKLKIV